MFRFYSYIAAPLAGNTVSLEKVNDPAFSKGTLGRGIAVIPKDGKVYAPADGTIYKVFATGHAIMLVTEEKMEILIHIGLDTVKLRGKYFTKHVEDGQRVKRGDLLMEFDLERLVKEGYDAITPIVVLNAEGYEDLKVTEKKEVTPGEILFKY